MALVPMEFGGTIETINDVITATDRSSGVTMITNKLYVNRYTKTGVLDLRFKTTALPSSGPLQLGRLQETYYDGNRPIVPLINDDTAEPQGSIYVNNSSTTVNVYSIQVNKVYIAYIPILLK